MITATNGLEALEQAQRHRPDIILMDMRMPELDGYQTTARLKANPALKDIPVIAVTASSFREEEARARKICDGFIRKPFNRAELAEGTVMVQADRSVLVQVIENLLSNAIKYSLPGKNIRTRVRVHDGHGRCEVQDEGPGLSAEDQKKLFGKFVRLSAKPTGGEPSTGLGLSIVKRMVEAMGGQVWCESEPGQGATFMVQLLVG